MKEANGHKKDVYEYIINGKKPPQDEFLNVSDEFDNTGVE